MLNSIPGLIYLAPVTKEDYIAMLDWSLTQNEYPVAIKVPGGSMISTGVPVTKDFSKLDTYEITKKGSRVAILGLGTFYETAVKFLRLHTELTQLLSILTTSQVLTQTLLMN